jgi:glycosyltransferase involved in cell wall biosynthesis
VPDTLIIAGGFRLPNGNAAAVRAIGLARLFQSLGLDVIILGKISPDAPPIDGPTEIKVEGVRCLDIRRPFPRRSFPSYERSAESVMAVVASLEDGRVPAICLYNYPALGGRSVLSRCKVRGLAVILDCTEWYGWEGWNPLRNVLRIASSEFRLRWLTRLAGNVICASSWFRDTLPAENTVLLPFVVDASHVMWRPEPARVATPGGARRFLYVGSPGLGLAKDRLDLAIEGFGELKSLEIDFLFRVAGLTRKDYLSVRPNHAALLTAMGARFQFLGRVSHAEALAELRAADYSLFFRKPGRVANTGFPTKYAEAASLGIPVITNPTSDLSNYLRDGVNGFMAEGISPVAIAKTLSRAAGQDDRALLAMKRRCASLNPFDIPQRQAAAREFLNKLRGVR